MVCFSLFKVALSQSEVEVKKGKEEGEICNPEVCWQNFFDVFQFITESELPRIVWKASESHYS